MPEPVEPTPADLQTFRDRMKAAIAEAGTTARAIEQSLGLSRGTFTRIYGGRRQLDTDLLTRAAGELGVDPQALVGGTALAALLQAPAAEEVAAPEPEETATDDVTAVVEPTVVEAEDATAGTEVEAAVEPEVVEVPQAAEGAEASGEPNVDEAGEAAPDAAEADTAQRRAEAAGDARRQRRKLLDVPARAAVAIAGGLALVGGTLVALLRRR